MSGVLVLHAISVDMGVVGLGTSKMRLDKLGLLRHW